MILVDTSVWIDHFRSSNEPLMALLETGKVLTHPFVIGELAVGNFRHRNRVLVDLGSLPRTIVAADIEVLGFIERHELFGRGIGYIDMHLLAAARLTAGATVWTRDARLRTIAAHLGLAAEIDRA